MPSHKCSLAPTLGPQGGDQWPECGGCRTGPILLCQGDSGTHVLFLKLPPFVSPHLIPTHPSHKGPGARPLTAQVWQQLSRSVGHLPEYLPPEPLAAL